MATFNINQLNINDTIKSLNTKGEIYNIYKVTKISEKSVWLRPDSEGYTAHRIKKTTLIDYIKKGYYVF